MLCNTILYYTILYYTILYYTILYYTILYYTILYYTILKDEGSRAQPRAVETTDRDRIMFVLSSDTV